MLLCDALEQDVSGSIWELFVHQQEGQSIVVYTFVTNFGRCDVIEIPVGVFGSIRAPKFAPTHFFVFVSAIIFIYCCTHYVCIALYLK